MTGCAAADEELDDEIELEEELDNVESASTYADCELTFQSGTKRTVVRTYSQKEGDLYRVKATWSGTRPTGAVTAKAAIDDRVVGSRSYTLGSGWKTLAAFDSGMSTAWKLTIFGVTKSCESFPIVTSTVVGVAVPVEPDAPCQNWCPIPKP